MRRADRHGGFTLAETLIAAAVLAASVVAISAAVNAGQMASYRAIKGERATRLGEELMERILALPYYDPQGDTVPGPELGEIAVSSFDNMDDFHGYTESAGRLADVAGNALPDSYQTLSRTVSAEYTTQTVAGLGGAIHGILVTVTVQDSSGNCWAFKRFVAQPAN